MSDRLIIQDEEGLGLGNVRYKRKILINGFCNYLKGKELESTCCVDCYAGFHGENAVETLMVQSGDYLVTNQLNNSLSICTDGMILRVKELIVYIPSFKKEGNNE